MFLAQKEMFLQLRQQAGNYSPLQGYKYPSHHLTEKLAFHAAYLEDCDNPYWNQLIEIL